MKRVFVYIAVILFSFSLGGIAYHVYVNMRYVDEQLLDNTFQALERAEKARVKLEAVAEAVKIKLDITNKILIDNQEKLKVEMAEVVRQQILAIAKDLITQDIYKKDQVELNAKLDKLLEKK